jgi:hypothetical protein
LHCKKATMKKTIFILLGLALITSISVCAQDAKHTISMYMPSMGGKSIIIKNEALDYYLRNKVKGKN